MGPIALFDKSFIQSLSQDESVWFDHFFMPVIAPLFYVETLADLEKAVREGRTPEREVGIIASKFPEASGVPTRYHGTLVVNELFGYRIEMDGRPIRPGGRVVVRDGKKGVVHDESPEAKAFSRWQKGQFLEIERDMARDWRAKLAALDLPSMAKGFRELGLDKSKCGSLEEARDLARLVVTGKQLPFAKIALVFMFLNVPREHHRVIIERWSIAGYPPLAEYAPFTAHCLSVELFFQFAIGAGLISADRPSNRIDIAYLNYLPFCMIFISSDKLHRQTAPLFMRPDQKFVWGLDLKADLVRINAHFMTLPEAERETGIMKFARTPPKIDASLVRELRAQFLRPGYDDEPRPERVNQSPEGDAELVKDLRAWTKAPEAPPDVASDPNLETQMMAMQRMVRRKKGSWFQVPKDMVVTDDEDEARG